MSLLVHLDGEVRLKINCNEHTQNLKKLEFTIFNFRLFGQIVGWIDGRHHSFDC